MPGCQWVLLGADGGLLEQAQAPMDEVFLAPAERVEVLVLTDDTLQGKLLNRYYDRAKMMVQEPHTDTALAHLSIEATGTPWIPVTLNALPYFGARRFRHDGQSRRDLAMLTVPVRQVSN